jgi:hypothetical protein
MEDKIKFSKDEVLEDIARATIEHDWDEVERLYKKLFLINDKSLPNKQKRV